VILLPIKIAIRVMAIAAVVVVGYFGVTAVQVWLTSRAHSSVTADAILVMGSAEYDGQPSPDLRARLNEALALFEQRRARIIAVTGSKEAGDAFTEAGVSAAFLHANGVPRGAIVVGGGSDSYENVSSVAPELKARGVVTVLVVTDPFHEDRSMAIASTFGFTPYPSPTTTSPITGWSTVPYFAKETLAVAAGRVVGYGVLSNAAHPTTR
jgi:uncharacterized SAM-binding protein YcdF (DUF218 family)